MWRELIPECSVVHPPSVKCPEWLQECVAHSCVFFQPQDPFLAWVSWRQVGTGRIMSSRTPIQGLACRSPLFQPTALALGVELGNAPRPADRGRRRTPAEGNVCGLRSPPASARPPLASPRRKERGSFEKTHHIFDVGLPSQKAVMATANVSICSSSLDPCAVCRYRGRKPANAVESTS